MTESPTLLVTGYASVDYALHLGPFQGQNATTVVRGRADEWPRYGGIAHVTRAASAAAAPAGIRVAALSWVGEDEDGHRWIDAVERDGTDCAAVVQAGDRSPTSHLLYPENAGTICLFDTGNAPQASLTQEQKAAVERAETIVVTIGPATATEELLQHVRSDARVVWVLKQDPASLTENGARLLAERANLISLSEEEEVYLPAIEAAAKPDTHIVITRGAKGADLYRSNSHLISVGHAPSSPVENVDTTGAGDTFIGTLAGYVAAHSKPLNDAAMLDLLTRASRETAAMLRRRVAHQRPSSTEEKRTT